MISTPRLSPGPSGLRPRSREKQEKEEDEKEEGEEEEEKGEKEDDWGGRKEAEGEVSGYDG